MKRRGFFGSLLALPVLGTAAVETGLKHEFHDSLIWNDVRETLPPVEEWVWVIFANRFIGLGLLFDDGVWVQPDNFVMHYVTHWATLEKPQIPLISGGHKVEFIGPNAT